MSLTKQQWLTRLGLFRCLLVEVDYLVAGELKTLYLSNHAYLSKPWDTLPNQPYKNWLNSGSAFSFSQRMSVVLYGETDTGTSAIEFFLYPEIEEMIAPGVNQADFNGQEIRVFIGDATWPRNDFIPKFTGQSKSLDPIDSQRARILFADKNAVLKIGVLSTLIESGPNAGAFKPRLLGKCFNVEPVLLDEVSRVYCVNDGPFLSVIELRENGFVISPANYSVDLVNGTVTINKNVTGRITLDAQGHKHNDVYINTAEQLINYLVSLAGQSAAVDSNILPGYELGLYIRSQRDIDQCLDEICLSLGGNWFYDELSQFRLRHHTGINTGNPIGRISAGQIEESSLRIKHRIPAIKSLTFGYQRNWTPQADGLAAAITENSPELAALYSNTESVLTGTNEVANPTASVESQLSTLIANEADALIELHRRLALKALPRAIYEFNSAKKAYRLGDTVNLQYPQFFSVGQDVLIVGHIHQINKPTDKVEIYA